MHDYTLQVPEIMSVVQEQFSVGLQNPYFSCQTMDDHDLPIIARGHTFPVDQSCLSHTYGPVSQSTCSVAKKVK